jgi:ABC-type Zn uptake system ZnuABC Zn-binding protein ZnuA
MNEIITVTDHAARMDDRWMFVALLIIGILAIGVLVKWFMKRWDASDQRVTEMQDRLDGVRDAHILYLQTANQDLAKTIAENTAIIKSASHVIADNTEMSKRKLSILDRMEKTLERQEARH